MKKICQILLVLFIITLFIQTICICMSKGYTLKYNIKEGKKDFLVEEKYISHTKGVKDHYEIVINDTFSFQIYENLHKNSRIIKQIKTYKDDKYTCIYPIFKSKKIKRDVLCTDGDKQIYYQNIKGNEGLDAFVSRLSTYDASLFKDQKEDIQKEGFLTLYTENLLKDHSFIAQNYKGVYVVNHNKIRAVSLYDHDVYDPKISAMVSKYFVTADYNEKFSFHKFYILDSTGNSKKEIQTKYDISYESYVQGVVGNSLYLIDPENKRQYEVNIKEQSVRIIGDMSKGMQFYENGKWSTKDMKEAISAPLYFNMSEKNDIYYRVETVPYTSYTYLFRKEKDKVIVSRKDHDEDGKITYLFETDEIRMIQYSKEFIYFATEDTIFYYSDATGLRTLAQHSEFPFNKDLQFFVYAK